jgi:hypothetical protein
MTSKKLCTAGESITPEDTDSPTYNINGLTSSSINEGTLKDSLTSGHVKEGRTGKRKVTTSHETVGRAGEKSLTSLTSCCIKFGDEIKTCKKAKINPAAMGHPITFPNSIIADYVRTTPDPFEYKIRNTNKTLPIVCNEDKTSCDFYATYIKKTMMFALGKCGNGVHAWIEFSPLPGH